ncbi:MAG: zinc-binding dehydrogenase [Propioniciclava sp.]
MSTGAPELVTSIAIPRAGSVEVVSQELTPEPLQNGEVRLRPLYLGICGSDLHILHGRHPVGHPPVILGHEMSAVVTEVGPGVTGLAVGDTAIVDPILGCGTCSACQSDRPNLCFPPLVAGVRAPGFGRTCHTMPAANVHVAQPSIPAEAVTLAEPGACASHCIRRLRPEHSADVLVIGAGTIGLSIIQALRITGAGQITVIEPHPGKRALALALGAQAALPPEELAPERTFSGVIDVVLSQPTLDDAVARVVPGGRVVMMGVPAGRLSFDTAMSQRFEQDLIGSGMYEPRDFERALDWIASGSFVTAPLISAVFDIDDAALAVTRAEEPDSIKVLIRLNQER